MLGLVVVLSVMLSACVPSTPAGDGAAMEDSGDMMEEVDAARRRG